MRHEPLVNRILSKIAGVKIAIRENLFYETFKGLLDFAPDDLINLRAAQALLGSVSTPTRLNFQTGTSLPIPFAAFQTLYASYGPSPRFSCRKITGGGWLTATITTPGTSASNGTYTAQPLVNDTGVYSTTGIGTGGTATVVVLGGVVTTVTKVAPGGFYSIGDTFTIADAPGAVFTIATGSEIFYQDLTSSATIITGEVTDLLPDNISIGVDDDGTGLLGHNIQIVISSS